MVLLKAAVTGVPGQPVGDLGPVGVGDAHVQVWAEADTVYSLRGGCWLAVGVCAKRSNAALTIAPSSAAEWMREVAMDWLLPSSGMSSRQTT